MDLTDPTRCSRAAETSWPENRSPSWCNCTRREEKEEEERASIRDPIAARQIAATVIHYRGLTSNSISRSSDLSSPVDSYLGKISACPAAYTRQSAIPMLRRARESLWRQVCPIRGGSLRDNPRDARVNSISSPWGNEAIVVRHRQDFTAPPGHHPWSPAPSHPALLRFHSLNSIVPGFFVWYNARARAFGFPYERFRFALLGNSSAETYIVAADR